MTEITRGTIASLAASAHEPGRTFGPWVVLELIAEIKKRDAEIERLRNLDPFIGAIADFPLGTRVRKIKGSSWQGCVVGYYSTTLTPRGVAVESEREPGSVQIYPVAAVDWL